MLSPYKKLNQAINNPIKPKKVLRAFVPYPLIHVFFQLITIEICALLDSKKKIKACARRFPSIFVFEFVY
jgi:hypothetical protein